MHRMYQVGLLYTFLCYSYIAEQKYQLFHSTRDDKLYSSVNGFSLYYKNINKNIFHNKFC